MKKAKKQQETIYSKLLEEFENSGLYGGVFDLEEKIGEEMSKSVYRKKARKLKSSSLKSARFAQDTKEGSGETAEIKIRIKKPALKSFEDRPNIQNYYLIKIKKNIFESLQKKFDYSFSFQAPPKGADADLSIPCHKAAKDLKANPVNLSRGVSDFLKKNFGSEQGFILKASSEGGYANISFRKDRMLKNVLKDVCELGDFYGSANLGGGRVVALDYSSPNIAKPMSVGHLRSTIIGNSIKNIYEFLGYKTVSINHLGDWGTQFGKMLYALKAWGAEKDFKTEPFKDFLDLYVKFHKEAEKDPKIEEKAREIFKLLEHGKDKELVKKWLKMCDISVHEFEKIYSRLGVEFDLVLGESFYQKKAHEAIDLCIKKGIAKKGEGGAIAVKFEKDEFPSFILRKSDGASVYAARDIAAAGFRWHAFKPSKIIYVVGSEQSLYFKQIFRVLEILGIGNRDSFTHLGFGMVSLPEGKMSTREGRVVFLEDLLNEAVKRAEEIVKSKRPDLKSAELKKISETVGVGAVVYADLSQFREKNIVFTWDKMMNLKGDSSPYIQYSFARAKSILEKAGGEEKFSKVNFQDINEFTKEEENLILKLSEFPEIVLQAKDLGRPDKIAAYLNELAQEFGRFYENVSVLNAENENLRNLRLTLVKSAAQVIKNGLGLLGIRVLEKM